MSSTQSSFTITDEHIPDPVTVTESAAEKVYSLMEEEGRDDLKLRISILGGGCSGFQYHFDFDEETQAGDTIIEKAILSVASNNQIKVAFVIDAMSIQYLMGAEIDYVDDEQGARFVIRNPNATTTCGCGSSFSA